MKRVTNTLSNRIKALSLSVKLLVLLPVLYTASSTLSAQTVTSLSALQTAINNASPGDVITLANGVYTASAEITITRQGTATQPITIQAQSTGGAEIRGSGGFQLNSPAKYIIIKGFKLTHATGTMSISSGATFITLTRNIFECAPAGTGNKAYLSISGDDAVVSYNTFQNKNTEGCMLTIQGPSGSGMAQRTWIHHNLFDNFMPSGANNSSAIQSGLSSRSLSSAFGKIEYNLFRNCRGENEGVVANKASDNIYRYNTISGGTELSLRHGDRMQVYGNFFLNSDGLRFCADSHKIYSNYFESCTEAINCVNGDGDVHNGDPLTSHDRPDNVQIVFNTMVNNGSNYRMPGRTGGLGATNITFANNILLGGTSAISISGSYPNPVWSGNILWNTSGGSMPSSGYTTANPLMAEDVNSVYHIQSGSPAIDASTGTYSYVTVDIDDQARSGTRDVGADELGPVPGVNRPLTTTDVGHNAGTGTIPAAPSSLTATAVSSSQINLSWSDNSSNETQFRIERSTNGGTTWSFLANAAVNAETYSNTGLATSTTYHYRVRAENAVGNSAFSNTANATTQGVPVQPTYQAENAEISQGVVENNWAGFNGTGFVNYDNVIGSYVEWDINVASAGTYNLAIRYANFSGVDRPMSIGVNGTITHSSLSFPVTTAWTDYKTVAFTASLNAGVNTIRATSTTASGGPNVDELQVNGLVASPPAAPSGLTASAVSASQINLSWTDNSNNEVNFRIERSTDGGTTWSFLSNAAANATTFSNTGLMESTTYHYRVRAENTAGNSSFSNVANATTPATIPAAPSALSATATSSSQINLSWTDNSNNEVNFRIERSTDGGATWAFLSDAVANATSFSNTGLTASTTYHYRVRAENAAGNSAFSNLANATTQGGGVPIQPTYQAESAEISQGVVESNWAGFNGTGFVNYDNVVGSYVEWDINVASAGTYNLAIRYANASGVDRPMSVSINGTTTHSSLSFPVTSAWTDYVTVTFTGTLNAGVNTLRATATTASGGPNVDELQINGLNVTPTNVALNKPVTASGSDTNVPANAVDGDNLTRWSASPMPQWLEVDLGAIYSISRTEVISYQDRAYQFRVEAKTTATGSYVTIVDRTTNTTPGSIAAPITNNFTAVNARYVRITVTGASGYTGTWASIVEFRVFGVSTGGGARMAPEELADTETSSDEMKIMSFPNPSPGTATLQFSLKTEGEVKLSVYNTATNKTIEVLNKKLKAGVHQTTFDASQLPKGIHIIRLSQGKKVTTYKLIKE